MNCKTARIPYPDQLAIHKDTQWIYTKFIYKDLLKLRNKSPHFKRNGIASANSTKQMAKSFDIYGCPIKKGQLSEQVLEKIQMIVDKRKCECADFFTLGKLGNPSLLNLKDGKNTIIKDDDGFTETCEHVNKADILPVATGKENKFKHIVANHRVLGNEEGCLANARFNNVPQMKDIDIQLKEKDDHIEILRKFLSKSMKIIKSLYEQIELLNSTQKLKTEEGKNCEFEHIENLFSEEITDGNLDLIGKFLDALQHSSDTENNNILSKKVEQLAEKYGDGAKTLAETLVKLTSGGQGEVSHLASPSKMQQKSSILAKVMDMSLSPIQTPKETGKDFKQVPEYIQKQYLLKRNNSKINQADFCKIKKEEHAKKKNHNKSCISYRNKMRIKGGDDINSSSIAKNIKECQEDNNLENNKIEKNINHIETAMSNFLGGFKDIKSELSQLGEAMQSCSQISLLK